MAELASAAYLSHRPARHQRGALKTRNTTSSVSTLHANGIEHALFQGVSAQLDSVDPASQSPCQVEMRPWTLELCVLHSCSLACALSAQQQHGRSAHRLQLYRTTWLAKSTPLSAIDASTYNHKSSCPHTQSPEPTQPQAHLRPQAGGSMLPGHLRDGLSLTAYDRETRNAQNLAARSSRFAPRLKF